MSRWRNIAEFLALRRNTSLVTAMLCYIPVAHLADKYGRRGEPARKALIIGEAKSELRARTYGAYYLNRPLP